MSHGFTARATWALKVPPGEVLIAADQDLEFPIAIKVSMASIDPTADPVVEEGEPAPRIPRSTLKMVRLSPLIADDSDDEEDLTEDQLKELSALIRAGDEDEDEDEDEAEAGPSNPKAKSLDFSSLKAEAATSDDEMEEATANGVTKKDKGKKPATKSDEEDSDIEVDSDDEDGEPQVVVVCTLDTERNYQQPLDIILPSAENIGFIVTGTHSVYLTGNLVTHYEEDDSDDSEEDSDEEDYDLEPDSDEIMGDSDEESDLLDGQRITEIDSDDEEEEEVPTLVASKKESKKASKKRPAEEEADNLDDMMQVEEKLSKKQLKKMKTNKGEAVATKESKIEKKKDEVKAEKKVQFAKNLEQGPSGSDAKKADQKKATPSITVVKGVKIDDRKIGQGRKVKNGDKVGVRYIGKLEDGKQFDANKKGPPFTFKVGKGEVIKGWEIGVQGMAVGGERRLIIPPSQAYGKSQLPGIPANSTLVFDIKLLEIK